VPLVGIEPTSNP